MKASRAIHRVEGAPHHARARSRSCAARAGSLVRTSSGAIAAGWNGRCVVADSARRATSARRAAGLRFCSRVIERRARKRRQVVERREIEAVLDRELGRLARRPRRGRRHSRTRTCRRRGCRGGAGWRAPTPKPPRMVLKVLRMARSTRLVEALEADQHAARSRCAPELREKVLVVRGVDAHLRDPANAERGQRLGELARERQIGGEIVVDEEEQLLLGACSVGELGDDRVDRPVARGALEEGLHGAELARESGSRARSRPARAADSAAAKQRAVVAHAGSEIGLAVGAIDGCSRPRRASSITCGQTPSASPTTIASA